MPVEGRVFRLSPIVPGASHPKNLRPVLLRILNRTPHTLAHVNEQRRLLGAAPRQYFLVFAKARAKKSTNGNTAPLPRFHECRHQRANPRCLRNHRFLKAWLTEHVYALVPRTFWNRPQCLRESLCARLTVNGVPLKFF